MCCVELQLSILYLANNNGDVCSKAMKDKANQGVVLTERWDLCLDPKVRPRRLLEWYNVQKLIWDFNIVFDTRFVHPFTDFGRKPMSLFSQNNSSMISSASPCSHKGLLYPYQPSFYWLSPPPSPIVSLSCLHLNPIDYD